MSEPEEYRDDKGRSLGSIKRPDRTPDGATIPAVLEALGAGPMAARNALEAIQVRPEVESVTFTTAELVQRCPVTGQPDHYDLRATAAGTQGKSIETKSLKLYLQWLTDQPPMFAEDLAGRIAADLLECLGAGWVTVVLDQHVRGGIVTRVRASATGEGST